MAPRLHQSAASPLVPPPIVVRTGWEHFPHGADVGVRGWGSTVAESFAQAGLALTAVVCEPAVVRPRDVVEIVCRAPSLELLLVDWLEAIIYRMSTERRIFGEYEVRIDGLELRARARGEIIDTLRHEPAVEVKGATLTALDVSEQPDGRWRAQCVVDV
jgi:SHS2 domain-containing protein